MHNGTHWHFDSKTQTPRDKWHNPTRRQFIRLPFIINRYTHSHKILKVSLWFVSLKSGVSIPPKPTMQKPLLTSNPSHTTHPYSQHGWILNLPQLLKCYLQSQAYPHLWPLVTSWTAEKRFYHRLNTATASSLKNCPYPEKVIRVTCFEWTETLLASVAFWGGERSPHLGPHAHKGASHLCKWKMETACWERI